MRTQCIYSTQKVLKKWLSNKWMKLLAKMMCWGLSTCSATSDKHRYLREETHVQNTQIYNTAKIFLMGICTHIWHRWGSTQVHTEIHTNTYKTCAAFHVSWQHPWRRTSDWLNICPCWKTATAERWEKLCRAPMSLILWWQTEPTEVHDFNQSSRGLCHSIKCLSNEAKDSSGGWLSSFGFAHGVNMNAHCPAPVSNTYLHSTFF